MTDADLGTKPKPAATGRLTRVLLFVAGLIVALGGVLQLRDGWNKLTSSSAGDPAVDAASKQASGAAQRFLPLAKDAYQVGKSPPRQSDPTVASMVAPVFDTGAITSKTMTARDLSALADWSMANLQVGSVYITAGTGYSDAKTVPNDPAVVDKINKNVVAYAPEFAHFMDTAAVVAGGMSEAGAAALQENAGKTNTKVTEGTEKMRGGIVQVIAGDIQTLAVPGLDDSWRRDRLAVLNDVAPRLAKLVQPAQCDQLRKTASLVSSGMNDAAVQRGLASFGAALKC